MSRIFQKPDYPVIYTSSFVWFWGLALAAVTIFGDLLYIAYVCTCMLILISHEHAHVRQCQKHGIRIAQVYFNCFGGCVDAEVELHPKAAVAVYLAGVTDTAYYAIGFSVLLGVMTYFGAYFAQGWRFLVFPELDFLWWCSQFAIIAVIANICPGTYHHKTLGAIRTDGWSAFCLWKSQRAVAE